MHISHFHCKGSQFFAIRLAAITKKLVTNPAKAKLKQSVKLFKPLAYPSIVRSKFHDYIISVGLFYCFFFWNQNLIGRKFPSKNCIGRHVHELFFYTDQICGEKYQAKSSVSLCILNIRMNQQGLTLLGSICDFCRSRPSRVRHYVISKHLEVKKDSSTSDEDYALNFVLAIYNKKWITLPQ